MSRHVAVLMGGWSAEREVSLVSGAAAGEALRDRGYRVSEIDVGRDLPQRLAELEPDVVYNALHGRFGEDGTVQGLLEIMGIPYTHSGVLASSLAMNKAMAKRLFASAGLRSPEGFLTTIEALRNGAPPMAPPYVIKPNNEGSSVGVQIVRTPEERLLERNDWPFGPEVLVERYVPGRELTVAVLGDRPLTVTEIRPRHGFYDYHAKYTEQAADHLIPAPIPEALYRAGAGRRAGGAPPARLSRRVAGRLPARRDRARRAVPAGGEHPARHDALSLVPEQAAHVGIGFADLVVQLVEAARCDT